MVTAILTAIEMMFVLNMAYKARALLNPEETKYCTYNDIRRVSEITYIKRKERVWLSL